MTVNLEWSAPHRIVSPEGTLLLNTPDAQLTSMRWPIFQLTNAPYSIVPAAYRAVSDNLSQADGSSLQPPFVGGLLASLKVQYWTSPYADDSSDRAPACDADLREMDERLTLHLNALRVYSASPSAQQRLLWTPQGYGDQRMLVDVLLASWLAPDFAESPLVEVSFSLATPFPYAIDATEKQTMISDGNCGVVTNTGNAEQSPVIRAYGPSTAFAITNMATGEAVSYDSSRPGGTPLVGATEYAEIDFFRGSIVMKPGNADLIASLDPAATTFFKLAPGAQTICVSGADITVLSNNSFL